jgi:hypothetical protein
MGAVERWCHLVTIAEVDTPSMVGERIARDPTVLRRDGRCRAGGRCGIAVRRSGDAVSKDGGLGSGLRRHSERERGHQRQRYEQARSSEPRGKTHSASS